MIGKIILWIVVAFVGFSVLPTESQEKVKTSFSNISDRLQESPESDDGNPPDSASSEVPEGLSSLGKLEETQTVEIDCNSDEECNNFYEQCGGECQCISGICYV